MWTPPSHGPNRESMDSSQPLAYTRVQNMRKVTMDVWQSPWMYGGCRGCMAVSRKGAMRRQDQVSPNNRHCLCLFPMCRACSHLLVHFYELLQSPLTGGINKKESWTSTTHACRRASTGRGREWKLRSCRRLHFCLSKPFLPSVKLGGELPIGPCGTLPGHVLSSPQ